MNVKLNVTENSRIIKLVLSGTGVRGASGSAGFTADEIAAIQEANAPDAANPFATIADLPASGTPASAAATGTAGQIRWDATHIYVCIATDTWKRAGIATWV